MGQKKGKKDCAREKSKIIEGHERVEQIMELDRGNRGGCKKAAFTGLGQNKSTQNKEMVVRSTPGEIKKGNSRQLTERAGEECCNRQRSLREHRRKRSVAAGRVGGAKSAEYFRRG